MRSVHPTSTWGCAIAVAASSTLVIASACNSLVGIEPATLAERDAAGDGASDTDAGEGSDGAGPGCSVGEGGVLFSDDFDDAAIGLPPPTSTNGWHSGWKGTWLVDVGAPGITTHSLHALADGGPYASISAGPDNGGDYTLKVDVYPVAGDHVALHARVDSVGGTEYQLALFAAPIDEWRMSANGSSFTAGAGHVDFVNGGVWHTVTLEVHGTTLTACLDGRLLVSATDFDAGPGFAKGGIGLYAKGEAWFDNLEVRGPAP